MWKDLEIVQLGVDDSVGLKVRELLRFPLNLTEFSVYFGPFEVTQMRISQCLLPPSFAPSLFAFPLIRVCPLHKL